MDKDMDKSLVSNKSYLDATNFRIITSKGNSSGALENVKGNKLIITSTNSTGTLVDGHIYLVTVASIVYPVGGAVKNVGTTFTCVAPNLTFTGLGYVIDTTDFILTGQYIVGACDIRDNIILFTTSNVGIAPSGGRSMIYKVVINILTETQTSISVLYDDSLNLPSATLNFSTHYPIKVIGRYETPNVQKVYWTDGYNSIRYANVADTITTKLTQDGTTFVNPTNKYMSVDKFDFLPACVDTKPILTDIVGGYLLTGVVAYAYQLYLLNGAETAFSSISDPIHITVDSDFKTNTRLYRGSAISGIASGKGVTLQITNTNIGFNRFRLIRLYYATAGSIPVIDIANEMDIDPAGGIINITDIGDVVSTLTVDEFNISSSILFNCQDIASKDNRLFAGNIEFSEFDISNWDSRAVRFRHWHETRSATTIDYNIICVESGEPPTVDYVVTRIDDNTFSVVLTNFKASFCSGRDVQTVSDVEFVGIAGDDTVGDWHTVGDVSTPFGAAVDGVTISNIVYSVGANTLTFRVNKIAGDFFGVGYDHIDNCTLYSVTFDYTYIDAVATVNAILTDSAGPGATVTITKPGADTPAGWLAAGWDPVTFPETHDSVNNFNDGYTHDGDDEYKYIYQSDGVIYGAEGPNIKIDFETEEFVLDDSNSNILFSVNVEGSTTNPSYHNFASPFKTGQLSWQRDEVYRLFAVFKNIRGQESDPAWIIDLRMPSLHDDTFKKTGGVTDVFPWCISEKDGTEINSYVLRPRIYFKSFPTGAVSAKIYRVKRNRVDRSVVTQCIAIPTEISGVDYYPFTMNQVLPTTAGVELVKLISPEININRNITKQSYDYLEYITRYDLGGSDVVHTDTATGGGGITVSTYKYKENTRIVYAVATRTDISDSIAVIPSTALVDEIVLNGRTYHNYKLAAANAKGCSGLLINYTNGSWSAENVAYVIVNYKSDVFNSQYGGHTYESRCRNVSIPCSDVITSTPAWYSIKGGDTFINYFQASTFLFDLAEGAAGSVNETVFVPLESSINCDLRHDIFMEIAAGNYSSLIQEYAGIHENGDGDKYDQKYDMYSYNSVYSQPIDVKYAIAMTTDDTDETEFDCLVKASNVKYNGELSDSWTKFDVNEEIEVDSQYGSVNGLGLYNNVLLYWQDTAFGMLSVNERSLITDNNSAQLVLGTGGLLDRFDYLSVFAGCKDKFSIVNSKTGVYWFDRLSKSIYKYSTGNAVINLSRNKKIQSYLDLNVTTTHSTITYPSLYEDEVLFTFYKSDETNGFTLSYNEIADAFISFYSFVPTIYIPYKDKYLTTTASYYCSSKFDRNFLFMHCSDLNGRCNFYGLYHDQSNAFVDSTIKLLFNEDYVNTKAYDVVSYISSVTALTGYDTTTKLRYPDIFANTFNSVRCYNDYQNTGFVTLAYGTNLDRRERTWAFVVPRNAVTVDLTSNPDIFNPANLSSSRSYPERIRDKYMIMDLVYTNTGAYDRFDVSVVGIKYRLSYR